MDSLPVDEALPRLKEALEVVGGDVDILREAAAMSLEEVQTELEALKAAVASGEAKGIEAKAHRLKGVMGNIGGMRAREIGQQLETKGEQGVLEGVQALAEAFEKEIGRVVAFYSDPTWEARAREYEEENDG